MKEIQHIIYMHSLLYFCAANYAVANRMISIDDSNLYNILSNIHRFSYNSDEPSLCPLYRWWCSSLDSYSIHNHYDSPCR